MSLDILEKVCEDDPTSIPDTLIPKLIPFITHTNNEFQLHAIQSITFLISSKPPSLNLDDYIQALFTTCSSPDTCQEVCRSFVMLLDHYNILPYLDQMIEYILFCNQSENTKVALEACDFWYHFARLESLHTHLQPYLHKVIPVIVRSLVYTDEDLDMFGETDENDPDPQQLPPRRNKWNRLQQQDDDTDDEDDEFYSEWTLRLFSATCLEALTTTFKSDVIHILLPILNQAFSSSDWRVVESGILALSTATEGKLQPITFSYKELTCYIRY